MNPQGLVPTLVTDDGAVLIQPLAIMEWLDETYPAPPLLPGGAAARAEMRGFALVLAADTHAPHNLRVLSGLQKCGLDEADAKTWAMRINATGLAVCESCWPMRRVPFVSAQLLRSPTSASFPKSATPGASASTSIFSGACSSREAACQALPAFAAASPDRQPDAE